MENLPAAPPALGPPGRYERVFRQGETVLLTARASWPVLAGSSPGARRISRFYEAMAKGWIARWEGPLLARARAEAGPETPPWEAELSYTVTLLHGPCLSLYWEAAEQAGGKPRRCRQGDIWTLPDGAPLTLRQLLPPCRWWRGPVLEEIRRQVGRRVSSGEAIYYEDWPRLVSQRFSPGRTYLTGEGPVVFYPVESIAPALEGFPTFSLTGAAEPGAASLWRSAG